MTTAVSAWLTRIGHAGPVAPDRATLAALVAAHAAAIPYENIDPLLGRPVDISLEALIAKLVEGGRGGFCFEQNLLLMEMLDRIGFRVTGLAARVLWNMPVDTITPRTHMVIRVDLPEGPSIVDVGFGGGSPAGIVDLIADREQPSPHDPYRLTRRGDEWWLAVHAGGEWRTMYRFDLTPQHRVDYEPACWFMATSPMSQFTRGLTCSRALPGRRLALRNFDYAVHVTGAPSQRRTLASAEEVCEVVSRDFGIALPDREALAARLAAGVS